MGKEINEDLENAADEEMTVTLELDDGTSVTCAIVTIFEVEGKDYIALLPLDKNGDSASGEVWLYGYSENEDDPNEEPVITDIVSDEEFEKVEEAFDEYLDSVEYDEIIDEPEEDA